MQLSINLYKYRFIALDTSCYNKFNFTNRIITCIIYSIVFLMLIKSPMPIVSDRAQEYTHYINIIANNGAFMFDGGLIQSSLLATWFPAKIQLLFNLSHTEIIFNLIPCLFYALMPAFIYLIARKYFNIGLSVLTAILPLSFFYFAYYSNLGRVSIAWGIIAGLIWAITSKKLIWSIIFCVLLVLAHYGTAYIMVMVLVVSLIVFIIARLCKYQDKSKYLKFCSYLVVCITTITLCWFAIIAPRAGVIINGVIKESLTAADTSKIEFVFPKGVPEEVRIKLEAEFNRNIEEGNTYKNLLALSSRDSTLQSAFGLNFPYMNTPQRIEFIISWIVVGFISLGLLFAIKNKVLNDIHLVIGSTLYLAILMTIIIPEASIYYGVVRTYFTTLPALAPCFVIGTNIVSDRLKIYRYFLPAAIIIMYYLAVSGTLHSWFGIIK